MNIRASNLDRASHCPGCINASAGIHEKQSDIADAGKAIHESIAWYFKTDGATIEAATTDLDERGKIIASWFITKAETEINAHGGIKKAYAEKSLSAHNLDTPDLIVECTDGTWHVFDWKTGYGEAIQAADSLQLAKYAMLGAKKYGYLSCKCYLFSAGNDRGERFTACSYDADTLLAVEAEIQSITKDCEDPKAPRTPGYWCKYCPAYMNIERCPESCATVTSLPRPDAITLKDDLAPAPEQITRILAVYDAIQTVKKAEKPFMDSLRALLEKFGPSALGDKIKFGTPRRNRTIADAGKAFAFAMEQDWVKDAEEFINLIVSVSASDLEAVAKTKMAETMGLKPKAAKEEFDKLATEAGVIEVKESAAPIERTDE